MTYWLDYSTKKLTGPVIKAAGYPGVVRYIDSPENLDTKHTNASEYASLKASGLTVWLVMQTTQTASSGGHPVGVDHAKRALAGAQLLGYTGPIFFTNDRPEVPLPAAWVAYLDGAASVLGKARVGAYGFGNAMDLAKGHATYFWQAGRRADVRPHVHLWQDNNTQVTVGGITCDRNLILKPITPPEDDMPITDDDADKIALAVLGYKNKAAGDTHDMHEYITSTGDNVTKLAADAKTSDVLAAVKPLGAKLDALAQPDLDALAEKVAAKLGDTFADKVADLLAQRLAQ